ncbi:MAG: glycosyltransferase [Oscillospiraceae bacterium]|jgi:glycosyltransferase involved in cell wall biosynthesis|nr:glycosyltransferase [Oscillospiraceae bacterium]
MPYNDLVSIVVPVYNVELYLERCIDSILDQTHCHLDILLVDDGSTDSSGIICDAYREKDARVRVIHKSNGGVSSARNTGIEQAKGDYICFVDSDDVVTNNYVECLLGLCKKYGVDMAMGNFLRFTDAFSTATEAAADAIETKITGREAILRLCRGDYVKYAVIWNKIYRTDLFKDIRYQPKEMYEDEATTYKLLYQVQHIAITSAVIYGYYTRQGSLMRSPFTQRNFDFLDVAYERAEFFRNANDPELRDLFLYTYAINLRIFCEQSRLWLQDAGKRRQLFSTYKKTLPPLMQSPYITAMRKIILIASVFRPFFRLIETCKRYLKRRTGG